MTTDAGVWEWAVFYTRMPTQPYRDRMTEDEAHEWIEEWTAGGGWPESFALARRQIGPWQFVAGALPSPVTPDARPRQDHLRHRGPRSG